MSSLIAGQDLNDRTKDRARRLKLEVFKSFASTTNRDLRHGRMQKKPGNRNDYRDNASIRSIKIEVTVCIYLDHTVAPSRRIYASIYDRK